MIARFATSGMKIHFTTKSRTAIECSVVAFVSIALVSIAAAMSLLIIGYLACRGDLSGKYIEHERSKVRSVMRRHQSWVLAFLFFDPLIDFRSCDRMPPRLVSVQRTGCDLQSFGQPSPWQIAWPRPQSETILFLSNRVIGGEAGLVFSELRPKHTSDW
jgi:hypothetical protein